MNSVNSEMPQKDPDVVLVYPFYLPMLHVYMHDYAPMLMQFLSGGVVLGT